MSHHLRLPSYGVHDEEKEYAALSLYVTLEAKPVHHFAIFSEVQIDCEGLFLHALVIVNSQNYHTIEKNSFIKSHMCGGTWRMTHCLHAFIVNITPEAKVLLKYHTYRYSPLYYLPNKKH